MRDRLSAETVAELVAAYENGRSADDLSREYKIGKVVDVRPALATCAACPVLRPCRAWALRFAVAGVGGGLTEAERRTWRATLRLPEPVIDISAFLPTDVVLADLADQARPDRHLRLV